MMPTRPLKRPFEKVYSSVPEEIKAAIRDEADRRGVQVSDVIRELLMERFADWQAGEADRASSS